MRVDTKTGDVLVKEVGLPFAPTGALYVVMMHTPLINPRHSVTRGKATMISVREYLRPKTSLFIVVIVVYCLRCDDAHYLN